MYPFTFVFMTVDDCQLRQIYGMAYNPFNNTWDWSKVTCINYALHATKIKTEEPEAKLTAVDINSANENDVKL